MKKRLGLFLCLILGLSLVGCKKDEPTPNPPNPPIVEDELKDQRSAATKELDEYVKDMYIYSSVNQTKIKDAISTAKKKIADAKTTTEINSAVTEAKATIDKLPTAAEENLAKAIADAGKELDSYVTLADYSEANQAIIRATIESAKAAIANCTTVEDVALKVTEAKKTIDALPTLAEEALVEKKATAKKTVEEYITDRTIYSSKGIAELDRIIKDAKENIDAAKEQAVIDAIVSDAKADLDAVLTISQEKEANALSFKNGLVADTAGALDTIQINQNKVIMDSIAMGTVRVYMGTQDGNRYSVLDTKLTPKYRSIEQSSFSIRFRAWDGSHGYLMKIYDDRIDIYTTVWSDALQGTLETLIVHNSFGMKDNEEVHLQILCHEWKKSVLIDGECIFTMEEEERSVGRIYIDTWQTGLIFMDPMYIEHKDSDSFKAEYEELLQKECINQTEQEKLEAAKKTAKEEIEGYITDLSLYSEANQATIASLIATGKTTIDACTTIESIEAAVVDIKLNLSAVKTLEREQLEEDATASKEEIEGYITDLTVYSETNQEVISKIIRDGKLSIDACDSAEKMQEEVIRIKARLDEVLTIEEELILRATTFKNMLIDTEGDDTSGVIASHISTENSRVIFDTKTLDLMRVHFANRDNKYAVLDMMFTPDYQESSDSEISIYFRAWTRSDGYKMTITKDSIHIYACSWNNGHTETLIMKNAYGIASGEEVHLQLLYHEWKKTVLINGECIFSVEEDARNAGFIFLETKKAGFSLDAPLFLEPTSSEAFRKDWGTLLDTPCINKSEAELLEERKVAAKIEIEEYISDLSLYSEANQAVIANLIEASKASIDACNSMESLMDTIADIKLNLSAVKTLEREQLEADATASKEEIEGYITDLSLYSEANQAIITKLINDAKLVVDACDNVEAMEDVVTQVKEKLDAVLTLMQESILRAEAFKNQIVEDTAGALNDIRVDGNRVVFDTKKANNSTRVRLGKQDGNNWIAFDTKIIVDYNNTQWDDLTIQFRAWDTNDGYKMVIKDSSIVISRCTYGTPDEELVTKNFGIKNGEETHLQILCCGWQKTVLINGEVVFSYNESAKSVGYIYLQTWETGLTFIDPVYTEYSNEDSFNAEYADLLWKKENE